MTEKKSKSKQGVIIVLLVLILVALCAVIVLKLVNKDEPVEADDSPPRLAYAEGTTVVRDSDALQEAVDRMADKISEGNMVLEYDAEASSTDGQTFSCYLANAQENNYDMYFDIYADEALSDEIYLSGLVPPGKALDHIKLNKKLAAGDHRAYLAFTTVEDDHETIHAQVMVAMTLRVTGK